MVRVRPVVVLAPSFLLPVTPAKAGVQMGPTTFAAWAAMTIEPE